MNMVFRRVFLISVRCCCLFSYKVRSLLIEFINWPILHCSKFWLGIRYFKSNKSVTFIVLPSLIPYVTFTKEFINFLLLKNSFQKFTPCLLSLNLKTVYAGEAIPLRLDAARPPWKDRKWTTNWLGSTSLIVY